MGSKPNCWEIKKCGREVGGAKAAAMGVCPAATFTAADGFCDGHNGGRACAYIAGTFCGGIVQGSAEQKQKNCQACDVYKSVHAEHPKDFRVFGFNEYVRKRSGPA